MASIFEMAQSFIVVNFEHGEEWKNSLTLSSVLTYLQDLEDVDPDSITKDDLYENIIDIITDGVALTQIIELDGENHKQYIEDEAKLFRDILDKASPEDKTIEKED